MRVTAVGLLLGVATSTVLARQTAPPPINTEVYLASFSSGRDGVATVGPLVNISNDPRYDNQPSFTPDSRAVLFTSGRDGKQTDIFRYDIASKVLTQLTRTPENEYSPLVTPDGRSFSVIRVEADGTQRLWRFDLDGTNPRLVLESIKGIGYHAWLDATHLALFVLGEQGRPNTLRLADTATGQAILVASDIGRCLSVRPGSSPARATYVYKGQTPWSILELDPATHATKLIAPLGQGDQGAKAEDYAWDPTPEGGQVIVAWGTTLMAYWPQSAGQGWRRIADLSVSHITNISRLAISRDARWLALVAEPAKTGADRP